MPSQNLPCPLPRWSPQNPESEATEIQISATLPSRHPYNAQQIDLIRAEFDRTWPWLEPALVHGGSLHTRDSLLDRLLTGASVLWPTARACGVLNLLEYPRAKVCEIWLVGGDLSDIMAQDDALVDWARINGCTRMTMNGRAGWERVLKINGWEHQAITLKRSI